MLAQNVIVRSRGRVGRSCFGCKIACVRTFLPRRTSGTFRTHKCLALRTVLAIVALTALNIEHVLLSNTISNQLGVVWRYEITLALCCGISGMAWHPMRPALLLPCCLSKGAKYRTTFGFGKKMECSLNRRRWEEKEEFEPEWDAD